jgi:hypothetical protein
MKTSHYFTFVILISIIATAVLSTLTQNWGQLGMCITAFAGWMVVAKHEQLERKANETLSG